MKIECSIVRDLLSLYVEDMVSTETAQYIRTHLETCPACRSELALLKSDGPLTLIETPSATAPPDATPFKRIMTRMHRRFSLFAYSLIIIFIFLGFSWTAGQNLMYNSLIMPVVGFFGYYVFRWKAFYKMPLLLLLIDLFVCLFGFVELSLYSAFWWTMIYTAFVFAGIVVALLLHFALSKEG